jgi:hypothetical protein
MFSSFLPPRAARSSARGWSQRIIPVVLVPASAKDTAKPAVRAKFPPLVIGKTMGTLVIRLKGSGDTIRADVKLLSYLIPTVRFGWQRN